MSRVGPSQRPRVVSRCSGGDAVMPSKQNEEIERSSRESWLRGDFESATRCLIEGYGPQILGFLVHTMRNEDDASEVFSRFCEHLWRGIAKFEGRSSFKTWAYRLATHAR